MFPVRWGDFSYGEGINERVREKCYHNTLFLGTMTFIGLHVHRIYPRVLASFGSALQVQCIPEDTLRRVPRIGIILEQRWRHNRVRLRVVFYMR